MPSIPRIKQREGTLKTSVRNIVNKNVCTCKYQLNSSERVRNAEKMGVCNSGGFEVRRKLTYSLGKIFVRIIAMFAFQGCPQGGVPLYVYMKTCR